RPVARGVRAGGNAPGHRGPPQHRDQQGARLSDDPRRLPAIRSGAGRRQRRSILAAGPPRFRHLCAPGERAEHPSRLTRPDQKDPRSPRSTKISIPPAGEKIHAVLRSCCTCGCGSDRYRRGRTGAATLPHPSDHRGRAIRRGRADRRAHAHSRAAHEPDSRPADRGREHHPWPRLDRPRAAPDGYPMVMGTLGTHAAAVGLYKNLSYDPRVDFEPVMLVASTPMVLVVRKTLATDTLKDFIAYAAANPHKLTFGSAGTGSISHLTYLLFTHLTRTEIQHVPYRGLSQSVNDLFSGQIDMMFDQVVSATPHILSGGVKPIAVTAPSR